MRTLPIDNRPAQLRQHLLESHDCATSHDDAWVRSTHDADHRMENINLLFEIHEHDGEEVMT